MKRSTQHIPLVVAQPHQQVVGFALLDSPSMWVWGWRVGWVAPQTVRHQLAVAALKRKHILWRHAALGDTQHGGFCISPNMAYPPTWHIPQHGRHIIDTSSRGQP